MSRKMQQPGRSCKSKRKQKKSNQPKIHKRHVPPWMNAMTMEDNMDMDEETVCTITVRLEIKLNDDSMVRLLNVVLVCRRLSSLMQDDLLAAAARHMFPRLEEVDEVFPWVRRACI